MEKPIFFVAGLPRSGSTLLVNLLGQNPAHHVGPTSGLIDTLANTNNGWMANPSYKAEGLTIVKPRLTRGLRSLVHGFYAPEFAENKIVFDKSRGWLAYIELLEEIFEHPVKVIVTVRDIRAVVASFEKLHRANPMYRHPHLGDLFYEAQTTRGRARILLGEKSVLGLAINRVRDAIMRQLADRMLIVPYYALTTQPQEILDLIHRDLGLPPFEYDPDNVEQLTEENDLIHGWGPNLHTIRRKIEPPEQVPWEGVLPPSLCQWLVQEYQDINALTRVVFKNAS